ncbi:MAG: ABC transporter permease subunit [Armatimonadota bacterium]|nr:ABC transporter permease subunit [Armatimonadota bacterium]
MSLWLLVSHLLSHSVIPTPVDVWAAFQSAAADGYLMRDMVATLRRVLVAFSLALLCGTTFGALLGVSTWFARIFDFWLTLAATTPSLLYVVTIYLWLGLNDAAAVVGGAAVVTPTVIYNVWQGMRSIDASLSEMARAFRVPRWRIVQQVLLPQTLPFLMAAARLSLALTWKIMIFIELLGRPAGVGYRIQFWYQLFNMPRVLASALPFLLLMLFVDLVLLQSVDRYLFRWRKEEAR